MQRIQNLHEGKRNQKKRHLHAFVFVPSVFEERFPTAEFWMISAENFLLGSRKKIAKCLMRTFTCRATFLYDFTPLAMTFNPPPPNMKICRESPRRLGFDRCTLSHLNIRSFMSPWFFSQHLSLVTLTFIGYFSSNIRMWDLEHSF